MLYHFSEDPNIEVFEPRRSDSKPELPPMVWAINEERSINYYFPRECPRVIFSLTPEVSEKDRGRFFSHTNAKTIIAVENKWYETIKNTTLYKYIFDEDGFELIDPIAGYYISYRTVRPISAEPIHNLIDKLESQGIELRFTPSLYPLRDAIASSSITDFSIIRFRNAESDW